MKKYSVILEVIALNPLSCQSEASEMVEVEWLDRWQVYRRLQELGVPCQCAINQPLMVQIASDVAAVQLWSVVRQLTAPRQELLCWLDRCWHYHA